MFVEMAIMKDEVVEERKYCGRGKFLVGESRANNLPKVVTGP
jgi:hypothetical protein